MRKEIEKLRLHKFTSDEASVAYKAKNIRLLFKELDRLDKENERLREENRKLYFNKKDEMNEDN